MHWFTRNCISKYNIYIKGNCNNLSRFHKKYATVTLLPKMKKKKKKKKKKKSQDNQPYHVEKD